MVPERTIEDEDAEGQWQEFIAGGREVLGAAKFAVPVPPVGDNVQVGALVVSDHGVLDDAFAARDRMQPEIFEQQWSVSVQWMGFERESDSWARLDVQCLAPVRTVERLWMNVQAVRPVLELVATGHPLVVARTGALRHSSPAAVLSSSLEVFKGRSSALDGLLRQPS